MVGNDFPPWETISLGGIPFPTHENHLPRWTFFLALPPDTHALPLWISLWMGAWLQGERKIPSWKVFVHNETLFPAVGNGFQPYAIISHHFHYRVHPTPLTLSEFSCKQHSRKYIKQILIHAYIRPHINVCKPVAQPGTHVCREKGTPAAGKIASTS